MTYELTDDQVDRIIEALRHRAAYMTATNRDDRPDFKLAEHGVRIA